MTITVRQAFYRLGEDGTTAIPCTMQEWAAWWMAVAGTAARLVEETRLESGWRVLTVFSGIDQRVRPEIAGDGPLIFVTRAWNSGVSDGPTAFSGTWGEALERHRATVEQVKAGPPAPQ